MGIHGRRRVPLRKSANKAWVFFFLGFHQVQETDPARPILNPVPSGNTCRVHTCALAAKFVDMMHIRNPGLRPGLLLLKYRPVLCLLVTYLVHRTDSHPAFGAIHIESGGLRTTEARASPFLHLFSRWQPVFTSHIACAAVLVVSLHESMTIAIPGDHIPTGRTCQWQTST